MDTTVSTRNKQAANAYGRTATLIRCNREQSSMCPSLRKHFIKSQSKDSGGSFDGSDSDELLDSAFIHGNKARKQTSTSRRPGVVLDSTSAESKEVTARTADCETSARASCMAHTHNGQSELIRGDCKYSSANGTRFCAHNISPIFSQLAKDLLLRRAHLTHQHPGVSDDVPGNCGVSDDACGSHIMDDAVSSSRNNEGLVHTWPCAHCKTEGVDMVGPIYQQSRHYSGDSYMLPLVPEADRVISRFSRSISDSGRSTGSTELSDCEKTSLNCSRSSGDIRQSCLSLDMGISLSSVESLDERSPTEPGGWCPHRASRMLVEKAEQVTHDNTCQSCFHSHARFCVPVGRVLDACDTCSCSSGSKADSQAGNLADLTEELPVKCDVPRCPSLNGAYEKTCCLANGVSAPTRIDFPTRRKRDFHSWETHLVNGAQEGCDSSIYELVQGVDVTLQRDQISNVSSQNPDVSSQSPDVISELSKHSPADVSSGTQAPSPASEQRTGHGAFPQAQRRTISKQGALATQATHTGLLPTSRPQIEACSSIRHSPSKDGHIAPCYSSASCSIDESFTARDVFNKTIPDETTAHNTECKTSDASAHLDKPTENSRTFGSSSPVKSGLAQFDQTGTGPQKASANTSCLRTIGTALRRMSSPGKNVTALLSSSRCKYDVQDAALGYLSQDRQRTLMQKFTSTKSSSFDAASLYVGTCPLKNSPSSPLLLSSSSSSPTCSIRLRSFSVGACGVARRRVTEAPEKEVLGSSSRSSEDALSKQHDDDDEDLLEENWFDAQKSERNRLPYDGSDGRAPKKAQQFGLSLHDIKNNTGRIIPLPVEETVEYLKTVGGDEVEGLFRRCARVSTMREVQERYDDGERIDFQVYSDPHLAAAILKKFLRELQEPLMTYDLFEPITRLHYLEAGKQLSEVQRILQDELPEDNYIILKYVFQFLRQVVSKADVNHMTAENIATVFGPNIAWPKGQTNLAAVEQAVKFSLILVRHFDDVFLR